VAKYYLIGLGGRGITSLEEFGVWKDVENVAIPVPGRKDYSPGNPDGVERMLTERKYTTQVLPRDKLISVLHQHIVENYADRIDLNYGYQVRPVDLAGSSRVQVEIAECGAASWQRISASLVIASDGLARTFANHMEEEDARMGVEDPFSVVRYEDDNQRVYKIIPFQLPSDWKHDLDYSFQGDRLVFDALPANDRGGYVGVLLMRRNDEMAQANVDPNAFSDFLNQFIPQFSSLLDDETIANVAKSAPSNTPRKTKNKQTTPWLPT
jgi:2-polyprenyl-6-methoxyphenol hydroxylase-like FAD-dependent oxidoreductase